MISENTAALVPTDLVVVALGEAQTAPEGEVETPQETQAETLDEPLSEPPETLQSELLTEQFLQIYLAENVPFLLPVANLVEIMKIPLEQVVPMFQMAPWVMGVYNCRGEVLWLADLNHFLDMAPWYEQQGSATQHTAVVIQGTLPLGAGVNDKRTMLGLIVNRVENMVACPPEAIEPVLPEQDLGCVEGQALPYLRGCWRDQDGTAQLILDGAAILAAMACSEP